MCFGWTGFLEGGAKNDHRPLDDDRGGVGVKPKLIDPESLRRRLRRVLSDREAERVVVDLFGRRKSIDKAKAAELAAEGVEVDPVTEARARKAMGL